MTVTYTIERRKRIVVNTDPQRRCYNGCYFSSELVWLGWESLNSGVSAETVEDKLKFWRDLNDYAISQRGESARCEFRVVEEPHMSEINYVFCTGSADPLLPETAGRCYMAAECPQTTAQLIDVLVKHYGSSHAVNRAVAEVWQTQNNRRKMLKVDALWVLYENIQRENSNV